MSCLLELLGKGLERDLMDLVLPYCNVLSRDEAAQLDSAVENNPAHTANKLRLAIHYGYSGASDRAKTLFNELLSEHPRPLEIHLAWSAMYASHGELDQAISQLQQAGQLGPQDGRVLFALGYCCERKGQITEALQYYRQGCSSRLCLQRIRHRLAAIYLLKRNYCDAIVQYQALQEEYPEDVWNYLVLGHLHLQVKQYSQAEANFERALTIEPDNFEQHDDQVESLVQAGQISEAIMRMQQIVNDRGNFPDSYVRLADLYSQTGNDEAAIAHYERAIEIHPGYLEAMVKLGTQHLRMGRFNEAAGKFNQAVEINDRLIGTYVGLALAQKNLAGENRLQQAFDTLELALALEPNTNLLFAEMNRLQVKASQSNNVGQGFSDPFIPTMTEESPDKNDLLDKQMERYHRKLRENPTHANMHYRYGLLLRGKGQTDQSITQFQEALQINPSFFKAQIKLGLALFEDGRSQEAEKQLSRAFYLDQESIELHYKLGLMYCDKMQFALSVEQCEISLKSDCQNADVPANLSLALQNMGLIDRAMASWQAVCELEPQSSLAFQAQRGITTLKHHTL